MAKVLNGEKRLCDVMFNGPIVELGCINGPAYKCRLTTSQIHTLVGNGKKVYEINPLVSGQKVLLTAANCGVSAFANNATPVVEETPVVEPIKKDEVTTQTTETPQYSSLSKKERKRLEWEEKQKKNTEAASVEPVAEVVNEVVETPVETTETVEAVAETPVEEAVTATDL